jgi:large subunit ribosomal protein L29
MKAQQYREMSEDELATKLEDMRKHLFDLQSQSVTEKIENSRAVRNTKRDIARVLTVMRERQK